MFICNRCETSTRFDNRVDGGLILCSCSCLQVARGDRQPEPGTRSFGTEKRRHLFANGTVISVVPGKQVRQQMIVLVALNIMQLAMNNCRR